MPFVMDRQGQKLNKFGRVALDYYSRDREWDDFRLLVQKPTAGLIEWHEEAITEVFNACNANPYFAKVVCASTFMNAVSEHDADIMAVEVKKAIAAEVPALDTNSFAHLWQDGIHKAILDRELDILRRCRVLVAIARTARRGQPITLTNIISNRHSIALTDAEIQPVLNEFVKRDVLREKDNQYQFVLPIFGSWLTDVGISRLSSDLLAEELARSAQAAEDAAYVQSDEVATLARGWPTYQGRNISCDEIRAWYEQIEGQ
jgi:hypothetical protein